MTPEQIKRLEKLADAQGRISLEESQAIRALLAEWEERGTELKWWREASDTGRIIRERDEARAEIERLKAALERRG